LIGDSDIHNGLSTSDENAFAGVAWGIDPNTMLPDEESAKKILGEDGPSWRLAEHQTQPGNTTAAPNTAAASPSSDEEDESLRGTALENSGAGITGVWAERNDRPSIFAALRRREVFATSGDRVRVRLFAGWNYDPKLLTKADWVSVAYSKGVPMGSDLPKMPAKARAPRFVVEAIKDPAAANLDRIQIIKLWRDGNAYKEKIFDVALSNGRKMDPKTGKAPSVGDTVNIAQGTYENTIGAAALKTEWRDPAFNPNQPAVYYARVLEIPTPRWSTILAAKYHLPVPKNVAAEIRERAWSSPIWFTPAGTAPR
jgi:hypothetical protein